MNLLCSLLLIVLSFNYLTITDSIYFKDKLDIIHYLPKLELHAHLHGSVRISTLEELLTEIGDTHISMISLKESDNGQVERPFELFPLIHKVVVSKGILTRITQEMIEDYMAENAIYLEIRSTPRPLPDGTSALDYVMTILDVIARHNQALGGKMLVKLALSIDRGRSLHDAQQTLHLIETLHQTNNHSLIDNLVGLDFSGNPMGGRFPEFVDIFTTARQTYGLNLTIHTAEAKELSEMTGGDGSSVDETGYILSFRPDRVGHMLFLREKHFKKLLELKAEGGRHLPLIEICPSTSYFVLGLASYADHPYIRKFLSLHMPISINTDDSAIFRTNITQEIRHMATGIDMKIVDLVNMEARSIGYAFVSDIERQALKEVFWKKIEEIKGLHENTGLEDVVRVKEVASEIDMSSLYTM